MSQTYDEFLRAEDEDDFVKRMDEFERNRIAKY